MTTLSSRARKFKAGTALLIKAAEGFGNTLIARQGASRRKAETLAALAVFVKFTVLMALNADPDKDADLMLRVKAGDHAALEDLVNRYKQPVMNLVYRFLRDATEAEDLAQNVFVQVYKSAARYEVSARFSTWLFTIARNLCLNELRRRARHPADSLEASSNPDSDERQSRDLEDTRVPLPTEALLHGELERKIEEAIASLPETQRTAILLCRRDDMSYEDIAKVIGCSLSATKSLIHRGRETLKQKLKPYLRSGEWRETRH